MDINEKQLAVLRANLISSDATQDQNIAAARGFLTRSDFPQVLSLGCFMKDVDGQSLVEFFKREQDNEQVWEVIAGFAKLGFASAYSAAVREIVDTGVLPEAWARFETP